MDWNPVLFKLKMENRLIPSIAAQKLYWKEAFYFSINADKSNLSHEKC